MQYYNVILHISRILHIHGAHAAGGSARVEVAGDGGDAAAPSSNSSGSAGVEVAGDGEDAAAPSSNSSCPDATFSCPDMLCHDVSATC